MFRSHSSSSTLLVCLPVGGLSVCLYRCRMDKTSPVCEKRLRSRLGRKCRFDELKFFLGEQRILEQWSVPNLSFIWGAEGCASPIPFSSKFGILKIVGGRWISKAMRCAPPTCLFEEEKDVHPPFPFHPSFIKVFYSEDEYSSNKAYTNHSFIRGAEGCASPIPFQPILLGKRLLKHFLLDVDQVFWIFIWE